MKWQTTGTGRLPLAGTNSTSPAYLPSSSQATSVGQPSSRRSTRNALRTGWCFHTNSGTS
jgi:hypothetical protein